MQCSFFYLLYQTVSPGVVYDGIIPVLIALVVQVDEAGIMVAADGMEGIDQEHPLLALPLIVGIGLPDPFVDRIEFYVLFIAPGDQLEMDRGIGTGLR